MAPRSRSGALVMALSLCSFALAAPSASATVLSGSGTDPAGDFSIPAGDITATQVSYDDATGLVGASVTLGAAPNGPGQNAFATVSIGTRSGDSCIAPAVVAVASTLTGQATWTSTDAGSAPSPFTASLGAGTVGLAFTVPAGRTPNCFVAQLRDGSTVYDATAVFGLAGPAAAPPPPPPPVTTTQASTTVAATVPKAAKLRLTVTGVPSAAKRNRTIALRLKVANEGSKATTATSVKIAVARGLSVRPARLRIPALKPGKTRSATLRVRLTSRARTSTPVRISATAGKVRASTTTLLRIGRPKAKPTPKTKPGGKPANPLVGTYWWRTENHVDYAWDNRRLYFLNDHQVWRGLPEGSGLPTSCTASAAAVDVEEDKDPGCVEYTYDAKTGALTLGDKTGSFKAGKLTVDANEFRPLVTVKAGTRLATSLERRTFYGICGLIGGCSTSYETLVLAADGQFVKSRSSVTTIGDPGIGPFTAAGSYPPDQHGTYAVGANSTLVLTFADGTSKQYAFAYDTNDAGQPDPVKEGVLLDADNYYVEDD